MSSKIRQYSSPSSKPTAYDCFDSSPDVMNLQGRPPVDDVFEQVNNMPFYSHSEPGISHPFNTASIKLRDNGMIDIFSSTNQGIRVDPNTKTVNIITNHTKFHVNNTYAWCNGESIWWTRKNFEIHSDSNIIQNAKKDWTVNIGGNASIKIAGTMYMKSGGVMTFDAPKYDFL